jgi:prephenate dehydrogenase
MITKLVVIGVGLIGGSFALALKRAGAVGRVVGVGRSRANLDEALALGVIDEASQDAAGAVRDADLVLLAMPVGQMGTVMATIAPHLPAHCLVTDAGSTKSDVAALARRHLASHLTHVVPGHPIAGAEQSGARAARAELFNGRCTVLTPLSENSVEAIQQATDLWRTCGAEVLSMDAADHDRVFAAVSHLPHLLAFALVDEVASRSNAAELFSFAASGFRDFTRIAGSSPEMWRDICLANRPALLDELDAYRARLDALRTALDAADAGALHHAFERASHARNGWTASLNRHAEDSPE